MNHVFLTPLIILLACGNPQPSTPHPTQYADGSYSVHGLQQLQNTVDTELTVTGYIVDIYLPPECHANCRTLPPHMRIADTRDEQDRDEMMMVLGYAETQVLFDQAVELANTERGELPPSLRDLSRRRLSRALAAILPIPVDFAQGNKIKLIGRFTRLRSAGFLQHGGNFNSSDFSTPNRFLLDYKFHETIEEPQE